MTSHSNRVVALGALAAFLDGYDVQALGLAVPAIAQDWGPAPAAFGPALSFTLVGMTIGALGLAPLADRLGRRNLLVAMLALVGLSTFVSAGAQNLTILAATRLVAGLGLGAIVPVAIALATEHAPAARRTATVTALVVATALGALAASLVAPRLELAFGWRGIFAVGAALPLVALPLIWAALPKEPRKVPSVAQPLPGPLGLLTPTLRLRTVLVWTISVLNLCVNYTLISWLPTVLVASGWQRSGAQKAAGLLALGGIVGGLVLGWLADRGHAFRALRVAYSLATVSLALFLWGAAPQAVWIVLILGVGLGAFGGQMMLGALTAQFYPAALRATGVGWSSGIGRVGSVLGPMGLAWAMAAGVAPAVLLGALLAPMAACALIVGWLPRALSEPKGSV